MGDPVRTGVATMLAVAVSLSTLARAQSDPADSEEALVIPVHPSTPTTVQLRDAIVDAWIQHRGEFLMEVVGRDLNVRPRPDTPVGTEAVIVVETSAARRRFRLRVVARPEDAVLKLALPAVTTVGRTGEAWPEIAPAVPAKPAASTPESAPAPQTRATLQPQASNQPAPEPAERAAMASAARAFDLSVHAVAALGITALDIPGYEPRTARQPHGALGLRLAVAPPDTWWALEAGVSRERLAGAMAFATGNTPDFKVRGPWLRAEVGVRARLGRRWMPSAYAGLGMHAHIRTTEKKFDERPGSVESLVPGAVLALGMGLQYRTRDVLLGLEFQARYGGPDDYLSIGALWTVGCFLDQGDEP